MINRIIKFVILPIFLIAGFFVAVNGAQATETPVITAGEVSSSWNNWQSSFSWDHTVAGADPVLIVTVHTDASYVASVSYGGQAMTLASVIAKGASFNNVAEYVYYLADPLQGEHQVSVNTIYGNAIHLGSAITFYHCDTADPLNTSINYYNYSGFITDLITTTAAGVMLVDAVTYNQPAWFTLQPGQDQTQYFSEYHYGQTNPVYSGESYKLAGPAGTQFMSWTTDDSPTSVHIIIALNPKYPPSTALTPVILIPGIMGSYLDDQNGEEVWPNIIKMMLPGDDSYLNDLELNYLGYPDENKKIMPTEIVRKILTNDYFNGLINELKDKGYQENINLFYFPYDWRLDINWIAGDSPLLDVNTLKNKIEQVLTTTGATKVNLIAHSMGGLVVKSYLQKFGTEKVNKFIDIATPQLGAPSAFKILFYGDNLDIYILNTNTVKNISQNMPSVFQLLPSRQYFNLGDVDYRNYVADIYDIDNNGVKGNLTYDETNDLLQNTGRNVNMLAKNDELHNSIDNLDFGKTYNIVGCGQPTLGKIYILNKEKDGGFEYGLKYINGDGTVPLDSAEAISAQKTVYSKNYGHANLPSAPGVKQLVSAILSDEINNFNYGDYNNLLPDKILCPLNGTQVSFHSPIDLQVYDEASNHLGPNANGDIEMGIAGASYDIIEGNKFVFLPEGHTYRVVGQATAAGIFNARIEKVEDGVYTRTVYYNEVPLPSNKSQVNLDLSDKENYLMTIDKNGDGQDISDINPSAVLTGEAVNDLIKPNTAASLAGTTGENNWYISSVSVTLSSQDNEGGSGILKTEYSLDSGNTWQLYQSSIIFNQSGQYNILFQATDRAGNVEAAQSLNFKIDLDQPDITINLPYDGQSFYCNQAFIADFVTADPTSGIAQESIISLIDDKPIIINQPVDLRNYKLGQHQLIIKAKDQAGNRRGGLHCAQKQA